MHFNLALNICGIFVFVIILVNILFVLVHVLWFVGGYFSLSSLVTYEMRLSLYHFIVNHDRVPLEYLWYIVVFVE